MAVKAKFFLNTVSYGSGTKPELDDAGEPTGKYIQVPMALVKLAAVKDGSEEDRIYGEYTPAGSIEMSIFGEEAIAAFHAGLAKKWYVTFDEAPE